MCLLALLQCSPCSTTVIVFSVAVVVTIDYESPVSCAISINRTRTADILYLDRLGAFNLGSLAAVTGNGTVAFVCGFFFCLAEI